MRYNEGKDDNPTDPLLNPAFFLSGTKTCDANKFIADRFLNWTISDAGQKVVEDFRGTAAPQEWLYTRAPTGSLSIKNCSAPGL